MAYTKIALNHLENDLCPHLSQLFPTNAYSDQVVQRHFGKTSCDSKSPAYPNRKNNYNSSSNSSPDTSIAPHKMVFAFPEFVQFVASRLKAKERNTTSFEGSYNSILHHFRNMGSFRPPETWLASNNPD